MILRKYMALYFYKEDLSQIVIGRIVSETLFMSLELPDSSTEHLLWL